MTCSRFAGKVVVVTGGGQGIGAAIAWRFATEGAAVLVTDANADSAAGVAAEISATGLATAHMTVDVTDRRAVDAIPATALKAFGASPDVIVLNAGVQSFHHALDVTDSEWERVISVNAQGALHCLQMAGALDEPADAVVAIASVQGRQGSPFYPHYAASKAALISLVKSFALALADRGTRVNAVAPGITQTALWQRAQWEISSLRGVEPAQVEADRIASIPLKRAGTPEDMAGAVAFLASTDAAYITGETIHVSGGDYML